MIFDSIENAECYFLNYRFRKALEFIKGSSALEDGNYEVCDGVTAAIANRMTQPQEKRKLEGHKKYADIQYLISGEESIGYVAQSDAQICEEYDEKRDVAFYRAENIRIFEMKPGNFMILFPQDLHMPQIGKNKNIRKIVVKVLLEHSAVSGEMGEELP